MTGPNLDRLRKKIDRRWIEIRGITLEAEAARAAGDASLFNRLRSRGLGLQDAAKKMESIYNLKAKDPYTQQNQ